jgi:hypothetical protein
MLWDEVYDECDKCTKGHRYVSCVTCKEGFEMHVISDVNRCLAKPCPAE